MSSTSALSLSSSAASFPPVEAQAAPSPRCLTDAKVKRIGYSVLAAVALGAAGAFIATAILASPPGWAIAILALVALACVACSGTAIYKAVTIKDYEDPKELAEMKQKAVNQDFQSLYKDHGAYHLAHDIFNEPGTTLALEALQNKFKAEIHSLNLETIERRYDLYELQGNGIAPKAWVDYTQGQISQLRQAENEYTNTMESLDRLYSGRTKRLQREVREMRDDVHWGYSMNNLRRNDQHRNRDSFWAHTAIDATAALTNLAIGLSDGPTRQQQDYEAGMSQAHTKLQSTRQRIHQEYSENFRSYLN